jgi:NAD+ synthase (glutamine-hydrolysing)
MQIALLQFNPIVGDFEGNVRRIHGLLVEATARGAELAVCSELSVLGYPPRDLLERPGFVAAAQEWTAWLVKQTSDVPLVFGSIGLHHGRLTNDAVVAQHGVELCRAEKQLLPNYDVFDEQRHFRSGERLARVTLAGQRCALSICEDAWATAPGLGEFYARDPLAEVDGTNTDLLLNLSASPFTLSKLEQRPRLFAELARRTGVPLVMVNQVGGNDELIFDGRSSVFDGQGRLLAQAKMFEPHLLLVDTLVDAQQAQRNLPPPCEEAEAAYNALVLGVRDYLTKCGFERAVLGLSGGIDSALVATIAADALGPSNVLGVAMPTRYSSDHSQGDALTLARALGIGFERIDIDPIFAAYLEHLREPVDRLTAPRAGDVTWENVQARIRGATIMAISNRTGALPLTTGNKSELAVGYCTLYGDMVGGLAVISDVPKTMVYRLARWANQVRPRIPENTLTKPPSAELRPDQKDEDSLPPYDVLDQVLEGYVEDQLSPAQLVAQGFAQPLVERVVKLVRGAEYKRKQAAPGLIITRKAFGSGRRIPVAQGYRELTWNK